MFIFIPLVMGVVFVVFGVCYLLVGLLSERARHSPGGLVVGVLPIGLGALIIWAYIA
jgi:hypothetical protein